MDPKRIKIHPQCTRKQHGILKQNSKVTHIKHKKTTQHSHSKFKEPDGPGHQRKLHLKPTLGSLLNTPASGQTYYVVARELHALRTVPHTWMHTRMGYTYIKKRMGTKLSGMYQFCVVQRQTQNQEFAISRFIFFLYIIDI